MTKQNVFGAASIIRPVSTAEHSPGQQECRGFPQKQHYSKFSSGAVVQPPKKCPGQGTLLSEGPGTIRSAPAVLHVADWSNTA